ncbi:MAG: sensor histidine kinase [Mangrovibacterium sp.]
MKKSKSIRQVVILATVSILCLLILQIWFLKTTSDLNQKYIHDVTARALLNTADKLFSYIDAMNYHREDNQKSTLVKRYTDDTYFVHVGRNINPFMLEQFLVHEFLHFGINQDFEFEIFNAQRKIGAHRICHYDKDKQGYTVATDVTGEFPQLPRNPKMSYYFTIHFPQYTASIDDKVQNWYIADILLILLMIFFGYTIYVVFRQRQLSEIQKNFVNNMTHEFKTPIAAIKLSTKVLEESQSDMQSERAKRYIQIINEQTQRLSNQVERILQAATLEDKEFHLDFSEVNLNTFIEKTIEEFRGSHLESEFLINFTPTPSSYSVQVDKLHMSNVVYNILDNAIKYCDGKAEIDVQIRKLNKQIEISFADNGIGISAEYRDKIFGRFFRVPTGNLHDVKGFGLGLDYVKKIINFHRWKITVKENIPCGTKFIITLNRYHAIQK